MKLIFTITAGDEYTITRSSTAIVVRSSENEHILTECVNFLRLMNFPITNIEVSHHFYNVNFIKNIEFKQRLDNLFIRQSSNNYSQSTTMDSPEPSSLPAPSLLNHNSTNVSNHNSTNVSNHNSTNALNHNSTNLNLEELLNFSEIHGSKSGIYKSASEIEKERYEREKQENIQKAQQAVAERNKTFAPTFGEYDPIVENNQIRYDIQYIKKYIGENKNTPNFKSPKSKDVKKCINFIESILGRKDIQHEYVCKLQKILAADLPSP